MQTSDKPSLIPVPFANSGTKNSIPTSPSPTPGLASLETGFPPATMTPIVAGGVPPAGADFNGILNMISAASRWAQAGGGYTYDSGFQTAIGGYPMGAMLLTAAADGYWFNTTENNTSNPDTGGAGWVAVPNGIATQAQAEAGTDNAKAMTPLRVFQAIVAKAASEAARGSLQIASTAEALAGADNTKAMTPIKVLQATSGRLLRRLIYTINGGVQQVSINGGAFSGAGAFLYTPDPLMQAIVVKACGGGGGGGGATNPSAGNVSLGAPGMCGAYGEGIYTKAQVGASSPVSIGAGGAGGPGSTGGTGGTTALGSLLSCPGGGGGSPFNNTVAPALNGNGGTTSAPTGANIYGSPGISQFPSIAMTSGVLASMIGGAGGRSAFGVGSSYNAPNTNGLGGQGYGDGGSGVVITPGGGTATGGAGNRGILIIEEYA